MILHLLNDEKFTSGIIDFFDKLFPEENKYVIITGSNDRLVYPDTLGRVQVISRKSNQYAQIIDSITDYEAVLVHYLDANKAVIINSSPGYDRFVWMIWGGDAYKLFDIKLYDRETEIVLHRLQETTWFSRCIRGSSIAVRLLGKRSRNQKEIILDAISRVKYCTTVLPSEYDLFNSKLSLSALYIPFSYGLKDFRLGFNYPIESTDRINILIGNSGYPSNNHMTAFRLLSGKKLGNRKVIVPLSYGPGRYIEEVIRNGQQTLMDAFRPLTEFLSFDDYYKVLAGCSICIMNHYRQQGMGNIIIVLWLGARLYMRSENIAYQYLIENGAIVFPLESGDISLEPLSGPQRDQNRRVVERLYNNDVIVEKARNLIRIVTAGSNNNS